MKRFVIAVTLGLLPVSAWAQGSMPAANWTGFYVGANVGYGWSKVEPGTIALYNDGFADGSISGMNYSMSGVLGGGQAGYNYQMGNWVLGAELDGAGTGIHGGYTDGVHQFEAKSSIDWLALAKGRVGYAFHRFLIYADGGLAAGDLNITLSDFYPSGTQTSTNDKARIGWTAGGGIEAKLAKHWSVKAEYQYIDLGTASYAFHENAFGYSTISGKASVTTDVVKMGVNYLF